MDPAAVIYFANPSTARIRAAISAGVLGCMSGPRQGNRIEPGWIWAVDNDCFRGELNAGRWISQLERNRDRAADCVFASVPDRVADPVETGRLWQVWSPVVRELGYRPAYVAQDHVEIDAVPWDDLAEQRGVLFVGGSTDWKRSHAAQLLAVEAQTRRVWVHWGRVNSRRRFAMAAADGDSADGTFLAFAPDKLLSELVGWLNPLPLREVSRGTNCSTT